VTDQVRSSRYAVNGVELVVLEAGDPDGPLILLAHGFPECSWSWRHQLAPLAAAGFHVLAPDQRGYGRSSAPKEVPAYGIEQLTGDLLGLVDATGHDRAVFVGHDWGALVVWEVARLHPERVQAVVGVSVPFVAWPGRPTELMRMRAGDRFFYMLYFQQVGAPERELEADVERTMCKVLWGASGEGYHPIDDVPPMAGTGFLSLGDEPPPLPWSWLTAEDLQRYVDAFEASGFFGPLSWYRNLDANFEVLKDVPADRLTMPSYFIAGAQDPVLRMDEHGIERMRNLLPGYRGETLIAGAGHWVQQESPSAFTAALVGFLDGNGLYPAVPPEERG
jgi:pimeloyl-ACP methyl ester carboxylesterase